MKHKNAFLGIGCFMAGLAVGLLLAPKPVVVEPIDGLMKQLSSQGRAEIRTLSNEINSLYNTFGKNITAERTRMLQAAAAERPDKAAVEFYQAGQAERRDAFQIKSDALWLEAIARMPRIDRRAVLDYYLSHRFDLTTGGIDLPFAITEKTK